MAGKDIIVLKQRELKRLHVIHKVLDETLKQVEAAAMLSLSDRQIRRIIKKVRVEGVTIGSLLGSGLVSCILNFKYAKVIAWQDLCG